MYKIKLTKTNGTNISNNVKSDVMVGYTACLNGDNLRVFNNDNHILTSEITNMKFVDDNLLTIKTLNSNYAVEILERNVDFGGCNAY